MKKHASLLLSIVICIISYEIFKTIPDTENYLNLKWLVVHSGGVLCAIINTY